MPILIKNLTVSYQHFPAIHHINAQFSEGEAWAICGPNGAGKSTLLKAIVGLENKDTGQIVLQNMRHQDIAYLPQQSQIDRSQSMTVFELTALGLWYEIGSFRAISDSQYQRIEMALKKTGMMDFAKRQISELSNGQFQRVLFARMLVQKSKFILLDEPFNAIDEQTTQVLLNILSDCLKEENQGVVAVLHDYQQVKNHFEYALLIARELIGCGKAKDVLRSDLVAKAMSFRQDISDAKDWCYQEPQ